MDGPFDLITRRWGSLEMSGLCCICNTHNGNGAFIIIPFAEKCPFLNNEFLLCESMQSIQKLHLHFCNSPFKMFQKAFTWEFLGISFVKGVEHPMAVMGIEKTTGQCVNRTEVMACWFATGHVPCFKTHNNRGTP